MNPALSRPAWRIETEQIRISIMECGAHVAEIVLKGADEVNPLWIQDRPTIDSDQFDPDIHGALYGTGYEARLLSGLAGHNLCFPFWGNPSLNEAQAGMTVHGETNIVRWEKLHSDPATLTIAATLLHSAIRFERTLYCEGQVVYFDETAENLSPWDRPVGWCEHVTLGPPFLTPGLTRIGASLTRGFRTGDHSCEFLWPQGRGQIDCDLTTFSKRRHTDLVNSFEVNPAREHGYFAAWHPGMGVLFGYLFSRHEFPWMNVWERNDEQRQTRGMEFSNTPVNGTMRTLFETPKIWGLPTCEWLVARGRLRKRFAAFSTVIPGDFQGVADLQVVGDKLMIFVPGSAGPAHTISMQSKLWQL
ncbi:MAG: hypothetical protein WB952_10510 [Terriglobales bacterium]